VVVAEQTLLEHQETVAMVDQVVVAHMVLEQGVRVQRGKVLMAVRVQRLHQAVAAVRVQLDLRHWLQFLVAAVVRVKHLASQAQEFFMLAVEAVVEPPLEQQV
jgi:hypothetical protein